MSDSLVESAELRLSPANADLPAWKNTISGVAALLLAILFFASGAWKLTDPFQWAQALTEFKVPVRLRPAVHPGSGCRGDALRGAGAGAALPALGELADCADAGGVHALRGRELWSAGRQGLQLFPAGQTHHWSGIFPGRRGDAADGDDDRLVGAAIGKYQSRTGSSGSRGWYSRAYHLA